MPRSKSPKAPETLDFEALAEWRRVTAELEAAGTLAEIDRAVLVVYVETWSVWTKACRHVAEFGPIVKLGNGVTARNPFYVAMKETGAQLRQLLESMGMTPAARAKVKASPADESEPDDLEI